MTSDIYTRLQSAFAAAIESGEINTYSRMTRGNEAPDASGDLYWTDDPAGPLVAFDCVFHRREERRELPASVWVILTDSGAVLHSESSGDDIGGPLLSYTYRLAELANY